MTATFGESVAAKLAVLSPKDRMDQIFLMLRSAMKERFGLIVHHEMREAPVYELVLAKGGPKFGPAPLPANEVEAREVGAKYNGALLDCQSRTDELLGASTLTHPGGRPQRN